jgi:hypothetical protein
MPAPYRLTTKADKVRAEEELAVPPGEMPMGGVDDAGGAAVTVPESSGSIGDYLDRLMKMVPAEAIGLYIVGKGVIGEQWGILVGWAVFCLAFVILLRVKYTADPVKKLSPDWIHIIISSVAFLIWTYSMGQPFEAFNIYNATIGSLLMLAYTAVVPVLYKGPREA